MKVIRSVEEWKKERNSSFFHDKTIGYVPTMGNLHPGHGSLIKRSVEENDFTVLTIYPNPAQFDDPNDFKNYPRTVDQDIKVASEYNADFALVPQDNDIYPDQYQYRVTETNLSQIMDGAHRDGHFDGVLTVVLKFFTLIRPHRAYFGEKDYQQFELIKGLAKAFLLDTQIIGCSAMREESGLAMSSRNQRLTPNERKLAATFPRLLQLNTSTDEIKQRLEEAGFEVEYIQEYNHRRYGAVKLGNVRLIDNFAMTDVEVA